jgi:hypothetical protein
MEAMKSIEGLMEFRMGLLEVGQTSMKVLGRPGANLVEHPQSMSPVPRHKPDSDLQEAGDHVSRAVMSNPAEGTGPGVGGEDVVEGPPSDQGSEDEPREDEEKDPAHKDVST